MSVRNAGRATSPNSTARAAMMCPPGAACSPGASAASIAAACLARHRISPPVRGPHSVLWVEVVATWTLGNHDVKFGFNYSDNDIYNFYGANSYGTYTFFGLNNFAAGKWSTYNLSKETSPGSTRLPRIFT